MSQDPHERALSTLSQEFAAKLGSALMSASQTSGTWNHDGDVRVLQPPRARRLTSLSLTASCRIRKVELECLILAFVSIGHYFIVHLYHARLYPEQFPETSVNSLL